MKQILQTLTLTFLLVSASESYLSAQTTDLGKATIASDLAITLDVAGPLVADYSFDVSKVAFKDEAAAVRFFTLCTDNILSYSYNSTTKKATVHIDLALMAPRGWDIAKYNEYFVKVSQRYRSNLMVVNE